MRQNIYVNGEQRAVSSATLAELVEELALGGKTIAVEMNHEIVPRSEYAQRSISSGDSLEIVHCVSGG